MTDFVDLNDLHWRDIKDVKTESLVEAIQLITEELLNRYNQLKDNK